MSLDREVLFAKKFTHSLLGEKILALQKARAAHSTADRYEIPQKDGNKISPYSPIFGEFLNSGNTSLIGEPIDWEGA